MNTSVKNPYRRSNPSEILQDFLEEMEISQYRLAKDTCIPHATVTKLMHGNARITANIAYRFSLFFGNSPQFWLNIQNAFDLYILEKKEGQKIEMCVKPLESVISQLVEV